MTSEECDRVLELEAKMVMGEIDILDFLDAVPDEFIPRRKEFIARIKEKRNETDSNRREQHDLR